MIFVAVPIGFAIGLALGTLGGGGSVLTLPVFVLILGESVHSATTASLAVVGMAAMAGAVTHSRGGDLVCWKHAVAVAVPALAGILIGTAVNQGTGEGLLMALFVPVMLAGAWATWRKAGYVATSQERPETCPRLDMVRPAVAGLGIGLLAGMFGVGAGFVVVPALTFALGFPIRNAIATSLVIVAAISFSGLGMHLAAGATVDVGVTAMITAACVAGALAGSRLAGRISHPLLARSFAVLMASVAAYMFVADSLFAGTPGAS